MSPQTQQMIMGLLMWVVVFGVFYFLLIRPQKKKDKELKERVRLFSFKSYNINYKKSPETGSRPYISVRSWRLTAK